MNNKKCSFLQLRKRALNIGGNNIYVVYTVFKIVSIKLIITGVNTIVSRLNSILKLLSTYINELYLSVSFI